LGARASLINSCANECQSCEVVKVKVVGIPIINFAWDRVTLPEMYRQHWRDSKRSAFVRCD
jgi:hypothetical protein